MAAFDVIVIGGGHNGLVAACYLAKAGLGTLVLERRAAVGGAAITDEIGPGFRCSTLAHADGPLAAHVVRDLQLDRHGLHVVASAGRVCALSPDGRALQLADDVGRSTAEIGRFSLKDAARYAEFHRSLTSIGDMLARLLSTTPPSIDDPGAADLWTLLQTGRRFRKLGRKDAYRLLRWTPMAVADLASEWFETELLRAVLAARGIHGSFLGPRSGGTGTSLLLRMATERHGGRGAGLIKGGLGALTAALASAATASGAKIRTDADVEQVLIKDGRACGVVLAGGEEVVARTVVSNADPRRTCLGLIDPVHLQSSFVTKIRNYRSTGVSAKVNLALSRLPRFATLTGTGAHSTSVDETTAALSGRIHIGPDVDYLERAFDAAKYGECSTRPYLDITIPSIGDPSLAPPGAHVMSIYMQYAPYVLRHGDWTAERDRLGRRVIETLADYAPDLRETIVHQQIITPLDLEHIYGLSGGHGLHGEMSLDQLFTMRPLIGWAQYRTPIDGLYLCGAGTHPGGGVTGTPGANAAREIARDLKARRV